MNKTAIKNFAVWAREKLISDITYKAGMLGINENGIADKLPQSTNDLQFFDIGTKDYAEVSGKEISQRDALVKAINQKEKDTKDYKEAFNYVVEEVAYTWFNRLIAIRFMEVNDYLPSGIRVLSSENKAKKESDLVTTPFDTDLEFTSYEQDKIIQLKDDNKLDELFRMLFIKQCNKLHDILPELFEKTDDYSELLLTISFTDTDGIVYHLVHDIDEDDFNVEKEGQVEIIGWMYQYYNIEPKATVFARPKNKKISKDDIPAATQLFTPDWIVRYMVENSLGRLWFEGHSEFDKSKWIYYLDEAEQEDSVKAQLEAFRNECKNLKPEEIKIIDLCMGSGHILVYAFDVLMQIYESYGYTQRDAARSILKNNIFGLDIDKRAYQLAYFAIMMKARQYNRRILTSGIEPNLCYIQSSNDLSEYALEKMDDYKSITQQLITEFKYASEYGSVLNVSLSEEDLQNIQNQIDYLETHKFDGDLIHQSNCNEAIATVNPILKQAILLTQKYDVVVTNPPYMPVSNADAKLNEYVKKNYPDSKTDLFAVFIERCKQMLRKNGYQAMITMHSWMFLSSYEKLREKMLLNDTINMAHLGARAFEEIGGEVVQTTAFVRRNSSVKKYKSTYCRLLEPNTQQGKEDMFLTGENRYTAEQSNFSKIPGSPIAYWVSHNMFNAFKTKKLGDLAKPRQGMATADNGRFVRKWYEVAINKTSLRKNAYSKWIPYNNGGGFRKWYGFNTDVVNWENNGLEIKSFPKAYVRNERDYFKSGITWNAITSSDVSVRYFGEGFIFSNAGMAIFTSEQYQKYLLAFINSCVSKSILSILSPTLNYNAGDMGNIPIIFSDAVNESGLCNKCIEISKNDWDAFETSWDFKKHPLVSYSTNRTSTAFELWSKECTERFNQLKANEEELNRIFIDIYVLQDELTPEVEDKDVTVRKADLQRDIKSLLSYAVGCMFGRYSLDTEGIAYAGGEWNNSKYDTFIPDADNCIPITDEEYFEDDIVGLFCAWLKKVYGEDTLEANLDFIANALGNKGKTSREVIRNYFLTDFIKDHIKTYQKRPIYWLFDSGKQNGFKALVYMHRWNADTIGNVRVEYLHRIQRVYEKEITRMQEIIDNSHDNKEISNATKRKEKLQKQIKETKDYDAKIAHLALSRIDIDLDDGVKVNYEKVQTADGKKMQILAKI
ncbi:MAG: BREX-1 system adenine-specific DNA-methyltransferase PglX [Peptostreptococcus porci]|nr:BREX-1 system adenine-specific DNA-methyltransferase PglX [Peptostreptococcus porci]